MVHSSLRSEKNFLINLEKILAQFISFFVYSQKQKIINQNRKQCRKIKSVQKNKLQGFFLTFWNC